MAETDWQERRDMEERLRNGQGISTAEAVRLLKDADQGQRSEAILEGLRRALKDQLGILVIDHTTDDDKDNVLLELIRDEEVQAETARVFDVCDIEAVPRPPPPLLG